MILMLLPAAVFAEDQSADPARYEEEFVVAEEDSEFPEMEDLLIYSEDLPEETEETVQAANTAEDAVELALGDYQRMESSVKGETFWYKFTPTTDAEYIINLNTGPDNEIDDITVNIYNSDFTSFQAEQDGKKITADFTTGETYYIRIINNSIYEDSLYSIFICIENNLKAWVDEESEENRSYIIYDIKPGSSKTLSVIVNADNMDNITYQWYDYHGLLEGATASSYDTGALSAITWYRCAIKDGLGNSCDVYFDISFNHFSATSNVGELKNEDWYVKVDKNETVNLSVSVSADDYSTVTYTWYKGDDKISDAAGDEYETEPITEFTCYSCSIKDAYNNYAYFSFVIELDNHFSAYAAGTNSKNVDLHVNYGDNVKLSLDVSAVDLTKVSYLWRNGDSWEIVSEEESYTVSNFTETSYYTCYVNDGYGNRATIYFTILPPAATGLVLDKTSADISVKKILFLTAKREPEDSAYEEIEWISSDPTVATVVRNGYRTMVTAKKYGTATITATTESGLTASCKIQTRFADVANPGKSYYKPVYWAVDNNITKCTVNFDPEGNVTRSQFVAFLYRMAGSPKVTKYASGFSDVSKSTKFYKEISWAVNEGIIKGFKDGTFKPNDSVTRAQAAIMLWRWAGKPSVTAKSSSFSDVKYAKTDTFKAIVWGAKKGIIKGSGGKFLPKNNCTRGQTVTFLYRYNQ